VTFRFLLRSSDFLCLSCHIVTRLDFFEYILYTIIGVFTECFLLQRLFKTKYIWTHLPSSSLQGIGILHRSTKKKNKCRLFSHHEIFSPFFDFLGVKTKQKRKLNCEIPTESFHQNIFKEMSRHKQCK